MYTSYMIKTDSPIYKTLISVGFSEKEAAVYLALLELEVAGVTEIAKKSNIKRSSTYVVLESLKQKTGCKTKIELLSKLSLFV